jgi:glycosyltransferase involved in cell wall biosynthesis
MRLSVVIPAYNESLLIGRCLECVHRAFDASRREDLQFECVVVDNNSSDDTAALARAAGVQVVFEPVNQIARARNAGAAAAAGEWLLFIDADSWLHPASLSGVLRAIDSGRVAGGGSLIDLEPIPWSYRPALEAWNLLSRVARLAAGSFVFCRADAFRDVGGFGAQLYAGEELDFSAKLKAWGRRRGLRFVILKSPRHVSSGRKCYLYSKGELAKFLFRWLLSPRRSMRDPRHLDYFYGGRR